MKILVVADEESKSLWDYYTPDKVEGIDLIISCGDLSAAYLEFLVTMTSCPVLYVPGNHDTAYVNKPPEGCENIDGRIVIHEGFRIFGLGGSMKYKDGPYMYTERQMCKRIRKARGTIVKNGGFDILVTHAPVRGYGDMNDLPHIGYECFDRLLNVCHPSYMLHGHVHASYMGGFRRESKHPSGTTIINGYDKYTFDLKEGDRQSIKRTVLLRGLLEKFL
ncbi:MAG: metallophosphoesterase [Lachnospiraceae bacterium]|nr:metallophosphoesterase [Lachnospiraceae bacterium]